MKTKILQLAIFITLISTVRAQDTGKMIVRNASPAYPKFIASLNGIRLVNEYNEAVTFSFLDDTRYRLKLFQAGSGNLLTFTVTSEPKYVSKYLITKDNVGNYSVVLESKSLITIEEEPVIAPSIPHTVTVLPPVVTTTVVVGPQAMLDVDYNEVVKSIKKESLESGRLDMAKTFFASHYLSAAQVLGVVKIFSLEASRLNFAKFAYSKTVDKANYFKVYEGFSLSNSKKEMSDYIKNNP